MTEGWKAVLDGKPNTDLIPTTLIVRRYFASDQTALEQLEAERDAIIHQMEELDEEHGGEDGLLYDGKNEKGKLSKASVKARLAEIVGDKDADDERKVLEEYMALIEKETAANKAWKEAVKALEVKVTGKYGKLTEDDIKIVVVDDKWMVTLAGVVRSELDRVSQALTGRIKQLAERYTAPLPAIAARVEELSVQVDTHLKNMGFKLENK